MEQAFARVDVKIDFDKAFNFTAVRSWRFDPAGNGEVKMARTQKDDPDAVKAVAEPIIVDAVTKEMQLLKLQRADSPDVIVRYFLLLTTNQTAQTMGQFLPGTVAWGLPPFEQTTQSLKLMNQGSLVIDLAANGNVVWRGIAQAKLKFDAEQAIDEFARNSHTSPKIIRTDEMVAELKEQMAQQERMQQMMQAAPAAAQGAQAAELLSRTQVGNGGSMLDQMMGQ